MRKGNSDFSMEQAARLAGSTEGKQLLSLLRKQNSDDLQKAMDAAAAGDYAGVQKALQTLMASQEAQDLLKKMGGNPHG